MTDNRLAKTNVRTALLAAVLIAAPLSIAHAQSASAPAQTVARTFMAAAQSQDRQAALELLDEKVSISFTGQASEGGHGEGQPFVIGYLDGLFYGQRAVSVDGDDAAEGATVRFLAHDASFRAHYAIDVEVRNARVIRVIVHQQTQPGVGQAVASLDPS